MPKNVHDENLFKTEDLKIKMDSPFRGDLEKIKMEVENDINLRKKRKYYKDAKLNPYYLPGFIECIPSEVLRSLQARMEAYHSKYKRAVSDGNVPDIEIACQNLLDDNEARIIENTVLSQKVPKRRKAVVDDNQSPEKRWKKNFEVTTLKDNH